MKSPISISTFFWAGRAGTAEDALKQIDDKGYMLPYKFEEGKNLVKVGVNISSQTRTVEKWIAR